MKIRPVFSSAATVAAAMLLVPCGPSPADAQGCDANASPAASCKPFAIVPVDDECNWRAGFDDVDNGTFDPDGDDFACDLTTPEGQGFAVRPNLLLCEDTCGAPSRQWCETLIVPRDQSPPRVTVNRPIVDIEMGDEWIQNWNHIEDVCDITFEDNCTPPWAHIRGIVDVQVAHRDEIVGGEPGFFFSDGVLADWAGFRLNLDINRTGPRLYAFTYAVGDRQGNFTHVDCNVRVHQARVTDFAERPDPSETKTQRRWIGQRAEGHQCPGAGPGWRAEPLFEVPEVWVHGLDVPPGTYARPDEGAVWCLYEWKTPEREPQLEDLPNDGERAPDEWLDPDQHVVGAAAGEPVRAVRRLVEPDLEAAFRRQTEASTSLPVLAVGGTQAPRRTRVAVVDGSKHRVELEPAIRITPGVPGVGLVPHGEAMGAIIQAISCPDCGTAGQESDEVQVVNHLALKMVDIDTPSDDGGYFGTLGELARQIFRAVAAWQIEYRDMPNQRPPMIINLSLGWNPSFNQKLDGSVVAGVAAMRAVIEFAACQGALVIAATGNDTGGPDPATGPMFPAAWEREPPPADCDGTPYAEIVGNVDYRPLIYAVGGVDGRDEPLSNARPDARSRLAAPSFYSMARLNNPIFEPAIHTGSSVATAVTSAVAAAVWRYRRDLGPAEVMALVYDTAEDLGARPDFCNGGACAPGTSVRRVSLCRALRAAIERGCDSGALPSPDCPTAADPLVLDCDDDSTDVVPAGAGENADLSPIQADLDAAFATGAQFDGSVLFDERRAEAEGRVHEIPLCPNPVVIISDINGPRVPCPEQQFYSSVLTPWRVVPQPTNDGCDICLWDIINRSADSFESVTKLGISEKLVDPIKNAQIAVLTDMGKEVRIDVSKSYPVLWPGELYTIDGIVLEGGGVKTAEFIYTGIDEKTGEYAAFSEPLLINDYAP